MQKFQQLNPPVYRASTILFEDTDSFVGRTSQLYDGFTYGLYGTPTTRQLEDSIAEIEGGSRCILVPSGLAALTHTLLALCKAGDHVLLTDCAYGPTRSFSSDVLSRLGVSVDFFGSSAASISDKLRPETRIVVLESPGYYTMEIQDIEAITREAHATGAIVIMDNSWGFGVSSMLTHGVDICCTALSKYASGAGDLCMGAITVSDEALFREIKSFTADLGSGVSADEAYMVMRGLPTLQLRIHEHARRAERVAAYLADHPAVARVMNPALPQDPYHERFRRYFRSSNGLFSVQFRDTSIDALRRMIDGFRHFRIGASWGSPHSLVSITKPRTSRIVDDWPADSYLARFHIGLEDFDPLLEDLEHGLDRLSSIRKEEK